jgi:hypothetical protein
MKLTDEIKTVDLVRKIRNSHAKKLGDKPPAEIMAFFNLAGNRAKRGLRRSKHASSASRRIAER